MSFFRNRVPTLRTTHPSYIKPEGQTRLHAMDWSGSTQPAGGLVVGLGDLFVVCHWCCVVLFVCRFPGVFLLTLSTCCVCGTLKGDTRSLSMICGGTFRQTERHMDVWSSCA